MQKEEPEKMYNCKVMVNKRVAKQRYGGIQNSSHGEKEKGRESKTKDKMVEN